MSHYHDPYSIEVFDRFLGGSCHCGLRDDGLRDIGDFKEVCRSLSDLSAMDF